LKNIICYMDENYKVFESARQARDRRFDGRFFIGVRTTGVYCRPVCPVKMPQARNVTFFKTAAAATESGYRPCLRCRPESSPGTPAWSGTSTTVSRALKLIGEGALDDSGITELSDRLGVTSRHLNRLFQKHLGAAPITIAQTRRLQFAKKLIDETQLDMTSVAFSSGYGSVRRFNDHFRKVYDRSPRSLRKNAKSSKSDAFSLLLPYREPFDFPGILSFLARRAIPGVEAATSIEYQRTIRVDGEVGRVRVSNDESRHSLRCEIELVNSKPLIGIVEKIRRLFDLDALPQDIHIHLGKDKQLSKLIEQNPGQRLPGSWDSFEIAVRAIVGQQISVKGATTVMGTIAKNYGEQSDYGLIFPMAEVLVEIEPGSLPMPGKRAMAIKLMARAILDDELVLGMENDTKTLLQQLVAIKGIGPWTAQYVAMRALNDPDAFLHNDLVIMRVAKEKLGIETEKELLKRAESWRPWRAYAGMHLWRNAG
jgi:AraC family transcriptional regulator of adaptative response / DNA-3-methyladenine glycosylase II